MAPQLFLARWYLEEQQQPIIIKITILLSLQFSSDSFRQQGKYLHFHKHDFSFFFFSSDEPSFVCRCGYWGMFIAEINLSVSRKQAHNNNELKLQNYIQTSKRPPITCLYSLALLLFNG